MKCLKQTKAEIDDYILYTLYKRFIQLINHIDSKILVNGKIYLIYSDIKQTQAANLHI